MFKRLKGSIGKIDEPKSSNSVSQNRPSWSGFSTISPINSEMDDSQFCIDDEVEETPKNSPARVAVSESTTVDLGKFSQSSSSLVNDHLSFHTDIESASELEDSVSVVSECGNEITKDKLYAAYKKLHGRYHKHKIKYTDLANKFKQTVTVHDKDKITMTKAQDKLLQRIAELKEQCTLEQAAKAHMEDALRNDIEERDHIISTLNTKIDLLKTNSSSECDLTSSVNSVDLLVECERLNSELSLTKAECASLEKQIELLKKSEESTLLSLAENKMAIHKELETKEDQIKKLEKTINGLQMENKLLLKEKAGHASTNSYQVNINQNVQEEITKQLNELEGEMSSAFEFKENKVKELGNQVKVLEQRLESQKKTNVLKEELLKTKEKEIKDLKLDISRLEQGLNDVEVSTSKKIDTFIKEIGEKSQIIKNLTNQLKDTEKFKQNYEKNEKELLDLKNKINQTDKVVKENESMLIDEKNRCIEELKLKSEEVSNLKKELQLLQCTIKDTDKLKEKNEKELLDLKNKINQTDKVTKENKSVLIDEKNRCIEELKLKSEEVSNLKKELQLLQCTIKDTDKLKENYEKNEKELLDLKNKINQTDKVIKENESVLVDEKNRCIEELKLKSEEVSNLKKELQLLQCTIKDTDKLKENYEKNEKELLDLKNKINQTDKVIKENESVLVDEKNRCIEELKLKSEEVSNLKKELQLLQCTIEEHVNKYLDLQNCVEEIKLKNNSLKESEDELKLKIIDYKNLNEDLRHNIKLIQRDKEMITESMNLKLEQNQLEFDKLNKLHKEMISQLNQDKLNQISEERNIESVIKDFNLLTEENAFLKKERHKILHMFHDTLNKVRVEFDNLKAFTKEQLTEWSLILVKHMQKLKVDYSLHIQLYHTNLMETKEKLESIKKAYFILKSECVQSLEYFKIGSMEKSNEDVMTIIFKNNEELEEKKNSLLRLHEEVDLYKKSEQRSVNAEVKETIQELQECIEVQKKTFTDLQKEYSNYQVTEKKKWTDKLIETENKWLEKMDSYKQMMDTEHREEIDALTKEWSNEQKQNLHLESTELKNEEVLEKIIQNVETTSQREEALQRQITKLNKELSELKKMYRNEVHSKHKSDEVDDDDDKGGCEMEYLRNILYEYMMGKQPMVLAKVLAAIVKFDSNQLNTILQKEEQKVSLLKTLGL